MTCSGSVRSTSRGSGSRSGSHWTDAGCRHVPMGVGEPSSQAGVVGVASVGVGVAAEAPASWVGAWSEEDCAGDCADCAWLSALGWREPQAVPVIVRVRTATEAMPMRVRRGYLRA